MKTFVIAVFFILFSSQAQAVPCGRLQAALDEGGRVQVEGVCSGDLFIERQMTTLEGPGTIVGNIWVAAPNASIKNLVIWGRVDLINALRTTLRDLQINRGGLILRKGAGLRADWLHFNGPGIAVRIIEWDTAFFSNILTEENSTSFRIGSSEAVGNLQFSNIILDRIDQLGFHVEPAHGGQVDNIQISNLWMANRNGLAPFLLNPVDGPISNVQITNWRFTDFPIDIWLNGPVKDLQVQNMIFD